MGYDRNHLKDTTEDGINDLVNDIIGGIVSFDQAFREIKFKPLKNKISKAIEIKDNEDWQAARDENTIDGYKRYVCHYNKAKPWYAGIHVTEAFEAIDSLSKKETTGSDTTIIEDVSAEEDDVATIAMDDAMDITLTQPSPEESIDIDEPDAIDESDAIDDVDSIVEEDAIEDAEITEITEVDDEKKEKSISHNPNDYGIAFDKEEALTDANDDINATIDIPTYEDDNRYLPIQDEEPRSAETHINVVPQHNIRKNYHAWPIIIAAVIVGLLLWFFLGRKKQQIPLSPEEISAIITQYSDSLRQDLFDGFYLAPISKADALSVSVDAYEQADSDGESAGSGLFSREEVIDKYFCDNGKFVVKNADGTTIKLPEAINGIDSVCVKSSPFFEYIDNNGLRRVVALYDNDLYYYLGDCGNVHNIRQFILVNQKGKYGILNSNKQVNMGFDNEKICQVPSTESYYVLKDGVQTTYQDGHKYSPKVSSKAEAALTSNVSQSSTDDWRAYYDYNKRKYGYKDSHGNIKINAQYEKAEDFKDGYAIVKGDKGYGIIAKEKGPCVPLQYSYMQRYGNLVVAQRPNGRYGVITMLGRKIIPFEYSSISKKDNFFKAKTSSGKYKLFNIGGKEILKDEFDDIAIYSIGEGLIPCQKSGKWGYISLSGEKKIDYKFKDYGKFNSRGLAVVKDGNNKYGYINKSGEYAIDAQFYSAGEMGEYGAQVGNANHHYARIDKNGNLLTQYYKEVGPRFFANRVYVANDSLIGFSDSQRNLAIPFMFDIPAKNASKPYFDEYMQLCKVSYKGIEWYINTNGAFAFPASGNPTDQDIAQQIQAAKAETDRKQKEKAGNRNRKNN